MELTPEYYYITEKYKWFKIKLKDNYFKKNVGFKCPCKVMASLFYEDIF